jgi:two-component system, cell cycle sensor histidine kinase and response regulator CckA
VALSRFFFAQEESVVASIQLKRSEQKYKELVEGANSVIMKWYPDGKIRFMNEYGLNFFGYTEDELLGRHAVGTIVPKTESTGRDLQIMIEDICNGKDGFSNNENETMRKDGTRLWINWRNQVLRNSRGEVEEILSMGIDISERKKAEEETLKFKTISDHANYGTAIADLEGNIIYVNSSFAEMHGFSPEGLKGTHLSIFHNEEQMPHVNELNEKLRSEGNYSLEEVGHVRKDGSVFPALMNASIIKNNEGIPQFLSATAIDITVLKKAEEELQLEHDRLAGILDTIPDGVYIVDKQCNIEYINPVIERQFGSIGDRKCYQYFHERSEVCPWCKNDEVFAGKSVRWEWYSPKTDRHYDLFDMPYKNIDGSISKFEIFYDITESKQAEDALRERQHLNKLLLDSLPHPAMLITKDRKVIAANRIAIHVGTKVGEYCWQSFGNSISISEETKEYIAAHDGAPPKNAQCVFCRADHIWEEEHSFANDTDVEVLGRIYDTYWIRLDDNTFLHYAIDVTDYRDIEEERSKAAKLESIGLLAGGIAHDFNNILTAILGNLSLAKIFAVEDLNKAKKILAEAEKATLSAKDLTQQLLTFSKGGEPVTKTIRINGLIADTVRFALRGSNVKCDLQLGEVLWPVDADEGQIKQVINNIAINACQAMPKGGVISIKTANVTVRSEDSLPLPAGEYNKITIRDQGIGIPEDYLSKVFDPYFTTKQKGNGLGLATCYSITKKHSGHIAVESEIGIGTAFHIYLPAVSKEIETREEVKKEVSIVEGKVLVMDDEALLIDTVSKTLEYMGCDMEGAPDGAEAVKLYKRAMKSDKPFDAVILDLTVPGGMGGQETVEKLLKIDPEVKAIVSSGYSNDPVMANFKEYGFSGVVSKPYQIEELRNVLHEVMKKNDN